MDKSFKILFVPNGGRIAPATRYRIYQYLPFLDEAGIKYKVYSAICDNTTVRMVGSSALTGLRKNMYYARVFFERLIRFFRIFYLAGIFDVVFLQRTTFPLGLEKLLRKRNKNIIFDIDDSIYMPDKEERGLTGRIKKYIKKEEVVSALKVSKCVIVENNHIRSFAAGFCANIHIITGPIDTVKNFPRQASGKNDTVIIGWIGSPSTTVYLDMLKGILVELSEKYDIKLNLVGAGKYIIPGVRVENVGWSEAIEVGELHKFDIGVMPMPDNEWTRGKVGCKMLQYMANAIPAVVSYTPTNAEIIHDGANGFLAYDKKDWINKISILIENLQLRKGMGLKGRQVVEERYSVIANAGTFIKILKDTISS